MTKEIFIDTADISQIKKWSQRLNISGITTNQLILFKEGKNFKNIKEAIANLCSLLKVPVSIELTAPLKKEGDIKKIIKEAKKYHSFHKNVVVKVPMTVDGLGLAVVKQLAKEKVPTNATAMMTFEQMLLAANAGADYVSLFYRRSIEYFQKSLGFSKEKAKSKTLSIIEAISEFIEKGNFDSKIIIGSVRQPTDVGEAFTSGAHIVTIPPKILEKMVFNPRTKETLEEFDKAWQKFLALKKS